MRKVQTSETFLMGAVLSLSGGFMDAYSYLCRGHVFANAQTGNLLLLGVRLSEGDWLGGLHYLAPILGFTLGIVLSQLIRNAAKNNLLHWRQITVLVEAILLGAVCFLPQSVNLLANSLTSFACGMQVESFRKIHGNGVATTMCIGNLRSGTENLLKFLRTRERRCLHRCLMYFGVILSFVLGAVAGNVSVALFAEKSITVSSGLLMLAFLLMFTEEK